MNSMDFYIGERVICSESGVIGDIIKFYKPTASEEQIMVRTLDGLEYHAPARTWKPYQFGFTANGKDTTGSLLNPYGEYVMKFAKNHGISIDAAHQHPTCKARLEYFNKTGR